MGLFGFENSIFATFVIVEFLDAFKLCAISFTFFRQHLEVLTVSFAFLVKSFSAGLVLSIFFLKFFDFKGQFRVELFEFSVFFDDFDELRTDFVKFVFKLSILSLSLLLNLSDS